MATFKDISGYEGRYQISDEGEVRSLARTAPAPYGEQHVRERIMRQQSHVKGYRIVFLHIEGKQKKHFVHRLVAQAFIPNSENTQHYWDHAKNDEPF